MPFAGNGTFTLVAGNPVVTGTTISSTVQNNTTADFATGFGNCMTLDGQSAPTANLPMATYKFSNLGTATGAGEALVFGQALNGTSGTFNGAVTGVTDLTTTGNTILGNAATDTLNVGAGGIIKDASGNVGIGATPSGFKLDFGTSGAGTIGGVNNIAGPIDTGAWTIWAGRTALNGAYVQLFGGSHATNAGQMLLGNSGTARLGLLPDGRFYGTGLHNNANPVTGTSSQYIASGTYTPVPVIGTNVTVTTVLGTGKWTRLGNVVSVKLIVQVTVTGAGASNYRIPLPIASNFAAVTDGIGLAIGGAPAIGNGFLRSVVATDDMQVTFTAGGAGASEHYITFSYEML